MAGGRRLERWNQVAARVEPDNPETVLIDLACSFDVFGPLNRTMWRPTDIDLSKGPPSAWGDEADDGLAEADLLLITDPSLLIISANGVAVEYVPIPATEQAVMSCP